MQNRYGLSESQRPTLRAAPRREHQAPQMAEAVELDQACPDAEVQPGCQQDVNEEPSPKKRTHWIDEILKLFHKSLFPGTVP